MSLLTLIDTLAQFRTGQASAADAAGAALARAQRHASLGTMISLDERATEVNVGSTAPLAGLPIVVKDNIDVAGMPTTAGSPVLAGHIPARSAAAVARLQAAGAVVIGKANLHEFALGVTTNNAAYGPARNPYAPDRICGGSSGGTAAAIAAGIVTAGLGTDTGGSIRIPAALCGIVGLRPTNGRWPRDGVVPISSTRDTVGPMARDVAACVLLDAVVCSAPSQLEPANLAGLRIGVPRRGYWEQLDAAVLAAGEGALEHLHRAGAVLVEVDTSVDLEDCAQTGLAIAMNENLRELARYFESHGLPFDASAIAAGAASPDVRQVLGELARNGAPGPLSLADALGLRSKYQDAFLRCFAAHRIEALAFPTTPLAAARIGEDDTVMLCGQPVSTFFAYTRNVGPASVVGLPSISLPMGVDPQGLPLGLCLDGPPFGDRRLLAIAAAVEAVLPRIQQPRI